MFVHIGSVLPYILIPSIEYYSIGHPVESIGDLYGTKNTDEIFLTHALPFCTSKREETMVQILQKRHQQSVNRNLENILDSSISRLGDFHTHLAVETDWYYNSRKPSGFLRKFETRTKYSKTDRKTMNKKNVYLIIGFGPKKYSIPDGTSNDGKSYYGNLFDYCFVVGAWKWNHDIDRFTKLTVTL